MNFADPAPSSPCGTASRSFRTTADPARLQLGLDEYSGDESQTLRGLKIIPAEVIEKDYGCGDPSKWFRLRTAAERSL